MNVASKCPQKKCAKKANFGQNLDSTLDSMEETRFKKKHQALAGKLAEKLHFSYTEVECLLLIYYKLQKENSSKGLVTKVQFRDVLHCALDMTDDYLMDRIFLAIDRGPSSCISMETWTTTLSLFLRGTLQEKIDYCFQVYDLMGDGILGRETMFYLLKNAMISQSGEEDAEESARDMIEVITKKMDIDRDGKISYSDYKSTVTKNPMLLEAFGQCLPSRHAVYAFALTFIKPKDKL